MQALGSPGYTHAPQGSGAQTYNFKYILRTSQFEENFCTTSMFIRHLARNVQCLMIITCIIENTLCLQNTL